MNVRKILAGLACVVALGLAGCSDFEPVSGKVVDKYIEHGGNGDDEHNLVVEDSAGNKHHFEIDEDQWETIGVGEQVNAKNLKAATD